MVGFFPVKNYVLLNIFSFSLKLHTLIVYRFFNVCLLNKSNILYIVYMKRVILDLDPKLVEAIDDSAWKNRASRVQELRNVLSKIYLKQKEVKK